MTHAIHLPDETYGALEKLAREREQSPETVVERLIEEARTPVRTPYETEDWFRRLGATEDQIRESARIAAIDEDEELTDALDADA